MVEVVLFGSKALELRGYLDWGVARDIDLLCYLSQGQKLAWNADRKLEKGIFVFDVFSKDEKTSKKSKTTPPVSRRSVKRLRTERVPLDLESSNESLSLSDLPYDSSHWENVVDIHIVEECDDGLKELFKRCFSHQHLCVGGPDANKVIVRKLKLSETFSIDVFVPPVTWLYALYFGHLHRIPHTFKKQASNIQLWKKYVSRFLLIREKFGYEKLDALMSDYSPENVEGDIMRNIYTLEFNHVTNKLGDAPSLDGKSEDTFFQDNVKRYLDHDELHKRVAKMTRGNDALPLFTKFIVDPNKSVMMDEKLFLSAPMNERLQTILEEIIVLYLERKALPAVVEHGEPLKDL